ncbi:MAG: hypothetical protein K1X89_16960 [Myxococcaceae bacterium]|nr:hypothetical protein [Myxococcaceae bacterium]
MRRSALALLSVAALAGCPAPSGGADAGPLPADSGLPPACQKPPDCVAQGFDGVCRSGLCEGNAACGDDAECSLGERCRAGRCAFTGCASDADCPTGKCLADSYSCVECGQSADCPAAKPVCRAAANTCAACATDQDCAPPGPAHCAASGACVHCTQDLHCPNGLHCTQGSCAGASEGSSCAQGIACDLGLVCVQVGAAATCLKGCSLYAPACAAGDICYALTFSGSSSLVFEEKGPLGVCFQPQSGLRVEGDVCTRALGGASNCQPNLRCVPEDAGTSKCHRFCDPAPAAPPACPAGQQCHAFPGDYQGRPYGLCYPDSGWGERCSRDGECRGGQSCQPLEDPSTFDELSPACQFAPGASPGLAPCADRALGDGGLERADQTCQSGACRADPFAGGPKGYFCYAACAADQDCSLGGRTGTCDGDFTFTLPSGPGKLRGCRPACARPQDCAEYDAGLTCRARFTIGFSGTLTASCAAPAGALPPGAACATNAQCRDGLCLLEDGRGVQRPGRCAQPCGTDADCAPRATGDDAGVAQRCLMRALLASRGFDGQAGTLDDVVRTRAFCGPGTCATDLDCAGDERCAADQGDDGGLALRCLPARGGKTGGEACAQDLDCQSGVCAQLVPPSSGSGKVCLAACDVSTACDAGLSCRDAGLALNFRGQSPHFDGCAP